MSQPCSCQQRSLEFSRNTRARPWPTGPHGESPCGSGLAGQRGLPGGPPRPSPHGSGSGGISSLPETPGSPSSSGTEPYPARNVCPAPSPAVAARPGFSLRGTRTPRAQDELPPWAHPQRAPPGTTRAPPFPPKSWQRSPRCRWSWSCSSGPGWAWSPGAEPRSAPLPVGQGCHPGHSRHGVLPALRGTAEP